MRIDSHQHFWSYEPKEFAWIGDDMAAIRRDFGPQDLKPLLDGHGIDGCIAVQAPQTVDETRWLIQLARQNPWIRGVVGWVDLRSTDVETQLDEFSEGLVGVRHIVQAEPDPEFLAGEAFNRGVAAVGRRNLAYDILIFPPQLPAATRFVDRHPSVRFVLDHLAKPNIREGSFEPWAADLTELSRRPNVWMKVSGMVTEADWGHWRPDHFRRYMDHALHCFGADRLMFGSDWPVCLVAAQYSDVVGIVEDWASKLSENEQAALFGGNASTAYRLS